MPLYVSETDRVINSTQGHSVRFAAGVPRAIPAAIESECLALGIRTTDAKTQSEPTAIGPSVRDVATAMREIIESGDDDKLTSAGKIRASAINDAMGEDVPAGTRQKAERLLERGEA